METNIVLMIIVSFIAEYLATMNMWVVDPKHIRFHMNDIYMVVLMVGWMFLLGYFILPNSMGLSKYGLVLVIIVIIFVIYAIRTQLFIDDEQFLNGMIPTILWQF